MQQTIPAREEDDRFAQVAKVAGFSLHAGVAAKAWEGSKFDRLCRYITRPAVSEKRLPLTPSGNIRYQLACGVEEYASTVKQKPAKTTRGNLDLGVLGIPVLSAGRMSNPCLVRLKWRGDLLKEKVGWFQIAFK
jgi:hypothetical protein